MSAEAKKPQLTARQQRVRAATGGSLEGIQERMRRVLLVIDAAEHGKLPDTPCKLPFPWKDAENTNAWASGAGQNLASYLEALDSLYPLAELAMKGASNGSA